MFLCVSTEVAMVSCCLGLLVKYHGIEKFVRDDEIRLPEARARQMRRNDI